MTGNRRAARRSQISEMLWDGMLLSHRIPFAKTSITDVPYFSCNSRAALAFAEAPIRRQG